MSAITETLQWRPTSEAGAPDDDTTVLIECEGDDEPVAGYHSGDSGWLGIDGMPITAKVTAWAHWPIGPRALAHRPPIGHWLGLENGQSHEA